jgi:PBP1b-binding outer membrane lipoprotein LpoB
MKAAILASALLLSGCAHTSHVQDVGNGMHSVTASANWGGYTGSREETIAQANDFCGSSRQSAAIENFEDKPGVNDKGEQTTTLTFSCVTRPPLQLK